jgi:transcriptional regulator with XRE-family HTH domain
VDGDGNSNAAEHGSAAERLACEIRRLRQKADLSQADVANKVGYTRQYVSRAEVARRNLPSLDLVRTLDVALGAGGSLLELREEALTERRGDAQPSARNLPNVATNAGRRLPTPSATS